MFSWMLLQFQKIDFNLIISGFALTLSCSIFFLLFCVLLKKIIFIFFKKTQGGHFLKIIVQYWAQVKSG